MVFPVSQRPIWGNPLLTLVSVILLSLNCTKSAPAQTARTAPAPTVRDAATVLAAGDLKQAETELQSILKTAPMDVHALNLLGIVRVQQKRDREAETLFQQALYSKKRWRFNPNSQARRQVWASFMCKWRRTIWRFPISGKH